MLLLAALLDRASPKGPRGYTGEVVIAIRFNEKDLTGYFKKVELSGRVEHPYGYGFMIFLCLDPVAPLPALWPEFKEFT